MSGREEPARGAKDGGSSSKSLKKSRDNLRQGRHETLPLHERLPSPQRSLDERHSQRPALMRANLPRSTSSIQTLSKLYQQQQQNLQNQPHAVTSTSTKPASKKPAFLTGTSSDKKLHKRVLSSTSLKNDFFTQVTPPGSGDNLKSSLSSSRTSSSLLLPKFQTMDSLQDKGNGAESLPEFKLNSSKIYERRRNREEAEEDEHIQDNDGQEVLPEDENEDCEDVVNQKYKEKLDQMNSGRNVEFFNSGDEYSDNMESDVDINSVVDEDDPRSTKFPQSIHGHESSSSSNEKQQSEEETEENKFQGFKGFIRRMTMVDELDDIPDSVKRSRSNHSNVEGEEEDGGFFSKFLNLGGGLAPGAAKDTRSRIDDEEAQNTFVSEDGTEMQNMNPELFRQEADDILKAHVGRSADHQGHERNYSSTNSEDQSTLKDSLSSGNGSFLAPNPDLYLRDESDIYEMNLDGGDGSFIAPPERVRGGVLSSLLKLYQNPQESSRSRLTLVNSEATSPMDTPIYEREEFITSADKDKSLTKKLKKIGGKKKVAIDDNNVKQQQEALKQHRKNASFGDIGELLGSGKKKALSNAATLPSFAKTKPKKLSAGLKRSKREQTQAKITVHIAETLQRQRFIIRLCKTLMLYGAPTHRLEEYLTMTARVLEIDAQFIYLPGCMIISFGDATTRTSEVQLVRCVQGLDLYKLHRAHRIYKKVIHDLIGVEDASIAIDALLSSKPIFSPLWCVLIYAFSSAMVTPFAFGGGWVDLPIAFGIGGCVGGMQYYISPRSNLYSNVFEVTASIVVSFIGRALGSISGSGICFSAIVQGSLALILPGYIILCGALELQSRNLVSGAVRMFYAIIYSLFLGFGLTLGSALYGWIDSNATSSTSCENPISPWYRFIFVPGFTLGLALINQAKWFQLPIMLLISSVGYVVTYFSSKYFNDSTEFTASLASFVIGVMGNLYSRIWKGIAVSAMLPGIFLQVPGGVGSQQTLLAGVENANRLTNRTTATTSSSSNVNGLGFGITMVQIVIGISVGLFASTIVVYPFGKKNTTVFTL